MKTVKLGVLGLIVALSLGSCKKGGVFCYSGNGTETTETRDVNDFTKIDLGLPAELVYVQSDNYSVQIEASENLMEFIKTDVKSNTLTIEFKKNKCYKEKNPIKIYISSPTIKGISISGSGTVTSKNKLTSNDLDLNISGSGDMFLDSLDIQNLDVKISGSGELEANGFNTIESEKISISGSGKMNLFDLPALTSDVNVSGSGNCDVNVINSLKVDISGSGNVRYKGVPTVKSNVSGSGNVSAF
jgi:hypothetical protein